MSKVGQPCFSLRASWTSFVLLVLLCSKKVSAPGVASGEVCDPILVGISSRRRDPAEGSGIFL